MVKEINLVDDYLTEKELVKRKTVRAIIVKEDKILMAYSKKYNDYMFPGGGLEKNEAVEVALLRELKEELGVNSIEKMALCLKVVELRGYNEINNINQVSQYYLVKTNDFGKQNLEAYEMSFGLEPAWVSIDDAIKQNEIEINKRRLMGISGVHPYATLKRANTVLKYLNDNKLIVNTFYEKEALK